MDGKLEQWKRSAGANALQDVNAHNSSIQKSTKAIHQETVGIVDAQLRGMTVQMAAVDEFVIRARSQNERHHQSHAESLAGRRASVQQGFSSVTRGLQTASLRVETFKEDIQRHAIGLEASLSPLAHAVRQPLVDMQASIQANPLKEYVPTGETPQKRDWTYTTSLPRTEDCNSTVTKENELSDRKLQRRRTPGKTPHRISSPRKATSSPSKLPSPSKARIYTDVETVAATSSASQQFGSREEGRKGGLKEINVNVARPSSSDGTASEFAGSFNTVSHPPLKRHATAVEGSRLPMKLTAKGKVFALQGRENVILSQSMGAGSGRRLRSSPRD